MRTRLLVLLGALCLLGPLSIDTYLPAFPAVAEEFGAGPSQVQLSLTTFIVGMSIGQLVIGTLSDSLGRRRPLLFGVALYAVVSLVCAVAPSAGALAALRLVQGFSVASGFVVALAIARDRFEGLAMARFMSLLLLTNGLGPVLAPVLGGQLLRFTTWRGTFVALALIAVVLFAVLAIALPETLPPDRRRPTAWWATARVFGALLTDRAFLGYALSSALSLGALFGYVAGASFALQGVFGLSPQQFSVVFGANSVAIFIAGLLNTALTGRVVPKALLWLGLGMGAVGGLGLVATGVFGGGLVAFLVPMFLVTTSVGVLTPNAATLAMARYAESAGSASAVLGVTRFVVAGSMAPLVGAGGSASVVPMIVVIAGASVSALVVGLVLTRGDAGVPREPVVSV
ncbi:multidrug effflux MFS transporter [Saccharothrix sp.]|uniref:multidrug effflux MFS transporter n=1 Tax=Saccharothrix sp. TaxID=1873460 RepID=UPI00281235A6|nr:multidrug effflux MFS transporter [Saccharothrix sp.]